MTEVVLALSPSLPLDWSIPREWIFIIFFGLLIFGRRIMQLRKGQHHD